jgi:hypothetical protein
MKQKTTSKRRKPPGRPEHKPTPANRRKVAAAAGGGMSHDEIAVALGISKPTLEKHYEAELNRVAYQKRMDALDRLHLVGMKGNVAALKDYLARAPLGAVAPQAPEPKAPVKGKKEQANDAAVGAEKGSDWETLLTPGGAPN